MRLFLILFILFISCDKDFLITCTQEFVTYNVQVFNGNNEPINNLTSKVLDADRNSVDLHENPMPTQNGNYLLMDDSQKHIGSNKTFYFQLFRNDSLLIEETYKFSGGECHISKNSGKKHNHSRIISL